MSSDQKPIGGQVFNQKRENRNKMRKAGQKEMKLQGMWKSLGPAGQSGDLVEAKPSHQQGALLSHGRGTKGRTPGKGNQRCCTSDSGCAEEGANAA